MNESEITALAREYAEKDEYFVQIIQDDAEEFLWWLCKRFCLVEKESVRKEYHEIKLALGDGGRSEWEDNINMEKESLLRYLFPEIAKEVES